MQGVLMKTVYLGLRRIVLWFNSIMERGVEKEPLPFPVPASRFLIPKSQEQILQYLLKDFPERPEPSTDQPLCDRVPNKLLTEYKLFMATLFRKPFAQIFAYMQYVTALNKLMQFACAEYYWPSAMENDLGGVNARALRLVEKELDSATLFQSIHNWMENNGEPNMSNAPNVSSAFFAFINYLERKKCRQNV